MSIRRFFRELHSPANIIKIEHKECDKSWCDTDYLMLYANFQLLVNYVEIERASFDALICNVEGIRISFFRKLLFKFFGVYIRSRELGLKSIEDSIDDHRKEIKDTDSPEYRTQQFKYINAMKKSIELYKWWVDERDSDYNRNDGSLIDLELHVENIDGLGSVVQIKNYLEKDLELYEKDTEKLKELIDIREILWT